MRSASRQALRRVARIGIVRRRLLPVARRLLGSGTVQSGYGAGLWLDTDGTNPGYILGVAEPPVQELVAELRADDVFLDVGANVGFFSLIAARNGARVVAVEPHPRAAHVLKANATRNGVVIQVHQLALGDREAEAFIEDGKTHLTAHVAEQGQRVKVIPGDQLEIDPTLIKIDVEGFEVEVLDGLSETIRRSHPDVICELHGETLDACQSRLREHGYVVEVLDDGGMPHLLGYFASPPPVADTSK